MLVIVSSNEKSRVEGELGDSAFFDGELPFDFQLCTKRGIIAIERKKFPSDLITSVNDGRLARECAAMREIGTFRVVIFEGKPRYTIDDKLRVGAKVSNWSRSRIRNLRRSIRYVEACDIEDTTDIKDTIKCVRELQAYFDNPKHLSIRIRPNIETSWFRPTYEERLVYFYQGLPGVSIMRSRALAENFVNPMKLFKAASEDIMKIRGFSKVLSENISNFLDGRY